MSNNFPPFLYAIFVPVLAFFCLLPLLFAGLVGLGLWRFSRHADGKTTRPQKLTITGFRPPTRLADRRARVQANQIYKEKLAPANPAPRLAPKPALRRTNAGISYKKLAYPQRDADRYKYIEGQFSEFIHH